MTTKTLSEAAVSNVKDSFNFADTDGNGSIDFHEFVDLLKVLSPESNIDQAGIGFSMVDTDSDGQISYGEFLAWWKQVWWEF